MIGGVEAATEQHGRPLVGLTAAKHGLSGVIGRELGSDRAVTVFLLHIGRSPDELARRVCHRRQLALPPTQEIALVHDPMIGEFGHARHFDVLDDAVANADLGVRIGFAKRQCERAKAEIDIADGAGVEIAGERPYPAPTQSAALVVINRSRKARLCGYSNAKGGGQPRNLVVMQITPIKYGNDAIDLCLR